MVTVGMLLKELPAYKDEWLLIHPEQSVKDIIVEVLDAHEEFAPYYDTIALYFDSDSISEICKNLYMFLKNNIRYKEEKEESQTTALPTGLLVRGIGDCKHYSGFCGGVLDAINRLTGKKINWNYRFASYDFATKTPHHVFVVVKENDGKEIWIDPTPLADVLDPAWQIDKKIKAKTMALHRNIAGIDDLVNVTAKKIGGPYWQIIPQTSSVAGKYTVDYNKPVPTNPYFDGSPFLGMNQYASDTAYSYTGTDWNVLANLMNEQIAKGPHPGHTVDGPFVKWIFDTNNKAWNFYYPGGVTPGFVPKNFPLDGQINYWPTPVISPDGRLTWNKNQGIDGNGKTNEAFALLAWVQDLMNRYNGEPHIMEPQSITEFTNGKFGDIDTMNMFTQQRGAGFFEEVGKALEDVVNFVKDGVLTISGFIPRNAFLGLVAINAFNFAKNLSDNIDAGKWPDIKKTWERLGGNPDKLYGTIQDGKGKPAILGGTTGQTIGEPATAAALIAAAAPIVAALLMFLDKDGKVTEVLSATKGFLATAYPDIDLTAYGFLDRKTGKYIQFESDPRYNENLGAYNPGTMPAGSNDPITWAKSNPLPVAAGAAIVTYMLKNKRGQKKNYTLPLLIGGGTYLVLMFVGKKGGNSSTSQQLNYISAYMATGGESPEAKAAFNQLLQTMTPAEINSIYIFISQYVSKGITLPQNTPLYNEIQAIGIKYNIFT